MSEERYTIEQIIDAIALADYDIIHAIQYGNRVELENVLKCYLFEVEETDSEE